MSTPTFNFFTKDGIIAAITWMQQQTEPETISNIFLGDVLSAMVGETPDFDNLSNLEARKLKRKLDTILTGFLSGQQLNPEFMVNEVIFTLHQQEQPNEDFTLTKNSYFSKIALGEAPYEFILKNAIPAGNPPTGLYFQITDVNNDVYLFGGNLGGLAAGWSSGQFTGSFNLAIQWSNFGQVINKKTVPVKFTNATGKTQAEFPVKFSARSQWTKRQLAQDGETIQVDYYDIANFVNPEWSIPAENGDANGNYAIPFPLEMAIYRDGVELEGLRQRYQNGQVIQTQPNSYMASYIGTLTDDTELEMVLRTYDDGNSGGGDD